MKRFLKRKAIGRRECRLGMSAILVYWVTILCGANSQAVDFINLDFEAYSGSGTNYLPGWEWSTNATVFPLDPGPLVTAGLGLSSTNTTAWRGRYSAFLSTGLTTMFVPGYGSVPVCCGWSEFWQTATVPPLATHIRYLSSPPQIKNGTYGGQYENRIQGLLGDIDLSAGVPITMSKGELRYTTDIRALAGQEARLKFRCAGYEDGYNPGSWHYLDQIEFLSSDGEVIWPVPTPRCLEDFHASSLNTSLWEVAVVGTGIQYSANGHVYASIRSGAQDAELAFGFRSNFRGDWDVQMSYGPNQMVGTGTVGMALGADFGAGGTSKACVGLVANANGSSACYMTDWGGGPVNMVSNASHSGVFRLARVGQEVTGRVWNSASNQWQTIGTAGGFTAEFARVGVRVWNTGMLGGKGVHMFFDNLELVQGRAGLDGLAIKVFGLDESGKPTMAWDSAGIAQTNRYFVTRATNLADPVWERISGGLGEAATTNWMGSSAPSAATYYRIEVAPE